MPLFKRKNKSKRRTDTGGFTTYDDVFQIVKEEINDAVEFYEIEPAIVKQILLDPKDFPTKDIQNGLEQIPDYSYFGTIRARFAESQEDDDEIDEYI